MTDVRPAPPPPPARGAPASPSPMTAQESDQSAPVPGVGPATPSQLSPGPATTMEELGIGPRTPYPTGGTAPVAKKRENTR